MLREDEGLVIPDLESEDEEDLYMENLCGEKEEEGFDQLIPEESEGGKE